VFARARTGRDQTTAAPRWQAPAAVSES
jgi:hypothetical protein